jgi:proteasome lid subunit RPN8/RPN11
MGDNVKPKVKIPWITWEKIKALTQKYNYEFCYLLKVSSAKNRIAIDDIIVIDNDGTGAHTDMLQEALDNYNFDIMSKKVTDVKMEELKGWGHSHVNFGVTPSGDDVDTSTNTFGSFMMGWCLALIVNQKLEYSLKMYMFSPYESVVDCTLEIEYPVWDGKKDFLEECALKIKQKTYPAKDPAFDRTMGFHEHEGHRGHFHERSRLDDLIDARRTTAAGAVTFGDAVRKGPFRLKSPQAPPDQDATENLFPGHQADFYDMSDKSLDEYVQAKMKVAGREVMAGGR